MFKLLTLFFFSICVFGFDLESKNEAAGPPPDVRQDYYEIVRNHIKTIGKEWNFLYEKEGVWVFGRKTGSESVLAFKGISVIEVPMLNAMQVIRSVEDSPKWTPNLASKVIVEEFNYLDAITYSVNYLPWPASNRDSVMRSTLGLDLKRHGLNLVSKSLEHPKHPPGKDPVRAWVYDCNIFLRPLGQGEATLIDIDAQVDPSGLIPNWLSNFVQKKWPFEFIKSLERRTKEVSYDYHSSFVDLMRKIATKEMMTNMLKGKKIIKDRPIH